MRKREEKYIIVEPHGGLGNRITVLHSAIELARDWNAKVISVIWMNNEECGCDFEDIFEKLDYSYTVRNIHCVKATYKDLLAKGRFIYVVKKVVLQIKDCIRSALYRNKMADVSKNVISAEERELYISKLESNKVYVNTYRDFYGKYDCEGVVVRSDIRNKAAGIQKKYPVYIAMHIRRTDNINAIRISPTALFEKKIQEHIYADNGVRIYVATDDEKLYFELKQKYGENIIDRDVRLSRSTPNGVEDAMLELCILAGAKKLYGSDWSSFSNIAHLYGKNEYEKIVGAE